MTWPAERKYNLLSSTLPLALGAFAFFLIVGPRALNPGNIAWLGTGDPATHYLGWLFYRNAEWEFPIGLNSSYGLELGSSILYSDSNPFFAFIFKPFAFLLPQTFQYFGIWLFFCFIFQSVFGWMLIGLVTNSTSLRFLGTGLIVFAPPMIWRLHGHFSLVGHFTIIAALYFAFNCNLRQRKTYWGFLIVVTALVHAYLLAMILAIWITDLMGKMANKRISLRSAIYEFFTLLFLASLTCWQAGYFSVGSGASSSGFGFYRMNVLSPIDSSGWSYILKDFPEAAGDYEGFNYLGLGIIFLLTLSLPVFAAARNEIPRILLKHWHLTLLFLAFTLYAISNFIAIGTLEFKYTPPDLLLEFANIFRASGRIFWPVFYTITFLSIFFTIRHFNVPTAAFFLGLALTIQILDTSAGWLPIRKKIMAESSAEWKSPFINKFWLDAPKKYQNIRRIPIENNAPEWQDIAYYAGRNGLDTDAVYLARIGMASLERAQKHASEIIRSGDFDRNSLYILDDAAFRAAFIAGDPAVDLFARIDGFNVVAPGWKTCIDCQFSGEEVEF